MLHNVMCPWRVIFDDEYLEKALAFILDSDTHNKSLLSRGKFLVLSIANTSLLVRIWCHKTMV